MTDPTAAVTTRTSSPTAPVSVAIAGGTSGLGAALGRELRRLGCRVATIGRGAPDAALDFRADLRDAAGLGRAAASLRGVDVVVFCAGASPDERRRDGDVAPPAAALAVVAPALLLRATRLMGGAPRAAVFVTSGAHDPGRVVGFPSPHERGRLLADGTPRSEYASAKLAQILLAEREAGPGTRIVFFDPGTLPAVGAGRGRLAAAAATLSWPFAALVQHAMTQRAAARSLASVVMLLAGKGPLYLEGYRVALPSTRASSRVEMESAAEELDALMSSL